MRHFCGIALAFGLALAGCGAQQDDPAYPQPPTALIAQLSDFPLGSEGASNQLQVTATLERALKVHFPEVRWDDSLPIKTADKSRVEAYYSTEMAKAGWSKSVPPAGVPAQFLPMLSTWEKKGKLFALLYTQPYGSKGDYLIVEVFSAGLKRPQ